MNDNAKSDRFDTTMRELSAEINKQLEPYRLAIERVAQASRELGVAIDRWLKSPEGQRVIDVMGTARDEKRKRIRRESKALS